MCVLICYILKLYSANIFSNISAPINNDNGPKANVCNSSIDEPTQVAKKKSNFKSNEKTKNGKQKIFRFYNEVVISTLNEDQTLATDALKFQPFDSVKICRTMVEYVNSTINSIVDFYYNADFVISACIRNDKVEGDSVLMFKKLQQSQFDPQANYNSYKNIKIDTLVFSESLMKAISRKGDSYVRLYNIVVYQLWLYLKNNPLLLFKVKVAKILTIDFFSYYEDLITNLLTKEFIENFDEIQTSDVNDDDCQLLTTDFCLQKEILNKTWYKNLLTGFCYLIYSNFLDLWKKEKREVFMHVFENNDEVVFVENLVYNFEWNFLSQREIFEIITKYKSCSFCSKTTDINMFVNTPRIIDNVKLSTKEAIDSYIILKIDINEIILTNIINCFDQKITVTEEKSQKNKNEEIIMIPGELESIIQAINLLFFNLKTEIDRSILRNEIIKKKVRISFLFVDYFLEDNFLDEDKYKEYKKNISNLQTYSIICNYYKSIKLEFYTKLIEKININSFLSCIFYIISNKEFDKYGIIDYNVLEDCVKDHDYNYKHTELINYSNLEKYNSNLSSKSMRFFEKSFYTCLVDPSKTIQNKEGQLDLSKTGKKNRRSTNKKKKTAAKERLDEIENIKAEIEKLRNINDQMNSELQKLQALYDIIKAENEGIKAENENVKTENENLKGENESVKAKNNKIIAQNKKLIAENKQLSAEIKNNNAEKEKKLADSERKNAEIHKMIAVKENINGKNERMIAENERLSTENESLKAEIEGIKAEEANLKATGKFLKTKNERIEGKLKKLQIDIENFKIENGRIKDNNLIIKIENEKLKAELNRFTMKRNDPIFAQNDELNNEHKSDITINKPQEAAQFYLVTEEFNNEIVNDAKLYNKQGKIILDKLSIGSNANETFQFLSNSLVDEKFNKNENDSNANLMGSKVSDYKINDKKLIEHIEEKFSTTNSDSAATTRDDVSINPHKQNLLSEPSIPLPFLQSSYIFSLESFIPIIYPTMFSVAISKNLPYYTQIVDHNIGSVIVQIYPIKIECNAGDSCQFKFHHVLPIGLYSCVDQFYQKWYIPVYEQHSIDSK